ASVTWAANKVEVTGYGGGITVDQGGGTHAIVGGSIGARRLRTDFASSGSSTTLRWARRASPGTFRASRSWPTPARSSTTSAAVLNTAFRVLHQGSPFMCSVR